MARYMLDTDICSDIMKRSHPAVLRRLQGVPVTDVFMSVSTKSELLWTLPPTRRSRQGFFSEAGRSQEGRRPVGQPDSPRGRQAGGIAN